MTADTALPPLTMFRARCRDCGWSWDVVALPLPLTAATTAIKSTHCPMCANAADNTVAEARLLTDAEAAHKRRLLARPPHPEDWS